MQGETAAASNQLATCQAGLAACRADIESTASAAAAQLHTAEATAAACLAAAQGAHDTELRAVQSMLQTAQVSTDC